MAWIELEDVFRQRGLDLGGRHGDEIKQGGDRLTNLEDKMDQFIESQKRDIRNLSAKLTKVLDMLNSQTATVTGLMRWMMGHQGSGVRACADVTPLSKWRFSQPGLL